MSKHAKALDFINKLIAKFGKGGYIFRGTTRRYSLQKQKIEEGKSWIRNGINSNLYRWVVKEKKQGTIADEQENLKKIFSENENFSPARMEEEIVENARKMFPSKTEAHEILTELQHFGGKTNMIDFSRSMYVALFFACQGNVKKRGELIALQEEKLGRINLINYRKDLQKEALEVINPAGAQSSGQRVLFQGSVFVRPADGYINPNFCEIEKIAADLKEPVLEYLRVFHNITEHTVYSDLHGFIKNERNNETYSLYFYMGLASYNKSEFGNAATYYGKCIESNPGSAEAYNNRGVAYHHLRKFNDAVQDYSKSISLSLVNDRYLSIRYDNRGISYYNLQKYDLAIKDHNNAISLDPNFAQAYHNRGMAKTKTGDNEGAKIDFAKAKELDHIPKQKK